MKPRLLIFAGPNGSGKSTLTTPAVLKRFEIPEDRYINADEIAVYLAENFPEMTREEREKNAFSRARWLRLNYRALKTSFAFETVFSHPSTLLDMQLCKRADYEVIVIFVTTRNPEINVERVAGRFLAGGHDVPTDRIRRRYQRTMALLPRILEEANQWFVFDNSDEAPELIASFEGTTRTEHRLSLFWKACLWEPLEQREQDRWHPYPETAPPDEANAQYTGSVKNITSHYLIQVVGKRPIRSGEQLVRHDRLLLPGDFSEGELVTIRYKDGQGFT